jgi:hypothetical protein
VAMPFWSRWAWMFFFRAIQKQAITLMETGIS